MNDEPPKPVFTGAELALADTVILLMKVMSMHGIIDDAAISAVFADLQDRYRSNGLHAADAMTDYLRRHASGPDGETVLHMHRLDEDAPGEPA